MFIKLLFVFVFFYLYIANVRGLNLNNVNSNEFNLGKEQELIEKLLKNYNKKLRPSGTLNVKFALNLNQIINLIEKDQIIVLNAFIDHEWVDKRLSWDPEEYGNITLIRISGDQIWTPDTFIYTTADQSGFLIPQSGAYFVVRSEGIIFWPNPLTQMRVRCRMGILWFPFDDQLCIVIFGSWSYTSHYLNYTLMDENPVIENYTEHNEWSLLEYKPFRYEIKFSNWIEVDTFSEIRYKILIRRKPLFVIQNCVFPALMLCILTLVSFFIPFAQEMQIGISIMLSFSVFKLRLSDDVPVQSDSVPLINVYFTLCMTFSLTAMIWFSIVNLLKEKKHLPEFCRIFVIKYLCYFMCIKLKENNNCKNDKLNFEEKSRTIGQHFSPKSPSILSNNSKILNKLNDYQVRKPLIAQEKIIKKPKIKQSNSEHEYDPEFGLNFKKYDQIDHEIKKTRESFNSSKKMVWLPQRKSPNDDVYLEKSKKYNREVSSLPKSSQQSKCDLNELNTSVHSIQCENEFDKRISLDSSRSSSVSSRKNQIKNIIENFTLIKNDTSDKKKRDLKSNPTLVLTDSFSNRFSYLRAKNMTNKSGIFYEHISNNKIIKILNMFVFLLFLVFCVGLHLLSLIILPYFVKTPLSIED
ncbi:unnamed protein product [Brachionus calyciflorus]|uniref:Uncharacterized protein n=1 Tax=Brachionus calyciflorus TaxID=104777 RepID=A0A813M3P3_9BILA|nr:unnamed protein product [Brachionus calyciflorus]